MTPNKVNSAAGYLLYFLVAVIVTFSKIPDVREMPDVLAKGLIAGTDKGYLPVGSQFEVFEPYVAGKEKISFLFDYPYRPYLPIENVEYMFMAQSFFAPKIINPYPGEETAIVFCSSDAIARARAKQEGYQLVTQLGEGKGIAVKNEARKEEK